MRNFSQKNSVELINNGVSFITKTVEQISLAQSFIFIHTYILHFDEVTGPILNALELARKRGVEVYLLVDAFGSKQITELQISILKKQKIYFAFFKPLSQFSHFGRRLHQKVVLIDNQFAIIGGINMSKEYNLPDTMAPWLDYACILKGEEISSVYKSIKGLYLSHFPEHRSQIISYGKITPIKDIQTCLVKTNVNDWMKYRSDIYKSYLHAIRSAKVSINLIATYFIPGRRLLKELKKAKQRGVEINLVFGSQSDHPVVQKVEYYFYKWYLLNNFNIFEWQDSVVHGKLALIDDRWVTIGSYNHNYISRFGNLEMNLEIINKEFAGVIKREFSYIFSRSKQFKKENFESRFTFMNKLYSISSYLFLNIITLISLFFIYRRSKSNTGSR